MKIFTHPQWPNIEPVITDDPERIANLTRKNYVGVDYVEPEPVVEIPTQITLRQFRMALRRVGLFAQVEALKTAEFLTQQQRDDVFEFMEYSNFIERNHPLIQAFAPVLNVTQDQIDEVFSLGSTL
jgi:hypothetical protein